MTIALNRTFPRTLLAAGLAVLGTVASFTVTATPVSAQTAKPYTATLASPVEAPKKVILNGAIWSCKEQTCTGDVNGSSPVNACIRIVKEFGPLSAFVTPKGDLAADKLAKCNAAAA